MKSYLIKQLYEKAESSEPDSFTSADFETIARTIESIRTALIFLFDEDTGLDAIAEQEYLSGLNHIDEAVRRFKIAHYHQIRCR